MTMPTSNARSTAILQRHGRSWKDTRPGYALLFQLIRNPHSVIVDDESMAAAVELVRWFGDEAARVYDELGTRATRPTPARARGRSALRVDSRQGRNRDTTRPYPWSAAVSGSPDDAEAALQRFGRCRARKLGGNGCRRSGRTADSRFHLATGGAGDKTLQATPNIEVSSPSPVSPGPGPEQVTP